MRNKKLTPVEVLLAATSSRKSSGGGGGGITPTGTKKINIAENGNYKSDVTDYASVDVTVDVPAPEPTGTKEITIAENGVVTEDVAGYANVSVTVDVPIHEPSGTVEITENGIVDVSGYATADVNVPTSGGGSTDERFAKLVSGTISGDIADDAVTKVNAYLFMGTMIESVYFKNAINVISLAFRNCQYLRSVNLPSVTTVYDEAFRGCFSLVDLNIPSVTTISSYAFRSCSALTEVTLPNIKTISGTYVFFDCGGLTKFVAANLKNVGNYTFGACSSLKTVDILGGYNGSIGQGCFNSCSNMESLIIRATDGVTTLNASSGLESCSKLSVYVPDALVDSYKTATNWSTIADRIKPLSTYAES